MMALGGSFNKLRPFIERLDALTLRERVINRRDKLPSAAGVAELAENAPDSKSGGRKAVWVRFPPPAPRFLRTCQGLH